MNTKWLQKIKSSLKRGKGRGEKNSCEHQALCFEHGCARWYPGGTCFVWRWYPVVPVFPCVLRMVVPRGTPVVPGGTRWYPAVPVSPCVLHMVVPVFPCVLRMVVPGGPRFPLCFAHDGTRWYPFSLVFCAWWYPVVPRWYPVVP